MFQLTENMREYMERTLKEDYGVETDQTFNRAITDAWNSAQEKVGQINNKHSNYLFRKFRNLSQYAMGMSKTVQFGDSS